MNEDLTDSKSKIAKAAKKLFSQNGFDGTSTREIVKLAGVNISLISYYFGNKENVLFSLFDDFIIEVNSINDKDNNNIINELSSIVTQIIELRFKDPELITILQQEIIMNSKRTEKFKELLIPIWNRVKILLNDGKNGRLFKFKNINNAVSFVMSVAIFPRQNSLFIDFIEEDEEETKKEILIFILKGLAFN